MAQSWPKSQQVSVNKACGNAAQVKVKDKHQSHTESIIDIMSDIVKQVAGIWWMVVLPMANQCFRSDIRLMVHLSPVIVLVLMPVMCKSRR